MHAIGRLFPRGDRAPAIEPVRLSALHAALAREPALAGWAPGRTTHVASGFYQSQALELVGR
jgi:magnesium-protoporphyrin O-methyltransferase